MINSIDAMQLQATCGSTELLKYWIACSLCRLKQTTDLFQKCFYYTSLTSGWFVPSTTWIFLDRFNLDLLQINRFHLSVQPLLFSSFPSVSIIEPVLKKMQCLKRILDYKNLINYTLNCTVLQISIPQYPHHFISIAVTANSSPIPSLYDKLV